MNLLLSLGINDTFFIQLIIAFFSLFILTFFVFKRFHFYHLERLKQTVGNKNEAIKVREKIESVRKEYEARLVELNKKIDQIFSTEKEQAKLEQHEILVKTRAELERLKLQNEEEIKRKIDDIERTKKSFVENLSQYVYQKLVG